MAVAPLAAEPRPCRCTGEPHELAPACYRPGRPPLIADPEPNDGRGLFSVPFTPHATYRELARVAPTFADAQHWRDVLANLDDPPGPETDPQEILELALDNDPAPAIEHVLGLLTDAGAGWPKRSHRYIAETLGVDVAKVPTDEPDEDEGEDVDPDAAVEHVLEQIADVTMSLPTRKALADALGTDFSRVGTARRR